MFDTPITTDDQNLKKVLAQKHPALLLLYDSRQKDEPLQDALRREAKKNADALMIVRVDISQNPATHAQYGKPTTPALVTLAPPALLTGRKVKSTAENARPADVRAHIDHLLNNVPLPETKPAPSAAKPAGKKAAHVTDTSFRKEVLQSKTPVLVDFWAVWCGPCQTIAPYIDKAAGEYAGKVKVVKLNVDESPVTARQYNVQSIPTFILFQDGQPVQRVSGASPLHVQNMLKSAVEG